MSVRKIYFKTQSAEPEPVAKNCSLPFYISICISTLPTLHTTCITFSLAQFFHPHAVRLSDYSLRQWRSQDLGFGGAKIPTWSSGSAEGTSFLGSPGAMLPW